MKTSALFSMFTLLVAASLTATAAPRFRAGQPFPQIQFPALDDGRPTSIADYRGKKVLLHIFASW